MEKKLNVKNTLTKFALDQTLGALVNVAAFLGGVRALNGESMGECWLVIREVCFSYHLPCPSKPKKSGIGKESLIAGLLLL